MKTNKKTTKTTKTSKKFDYERSAQIAGLLGTFAQFMPQLDSGFIPLFSREFVMKDLLGLTDEEFERNETLLTAESTRILDAIRMQKNLLETLQKSADEIQTEQPVVRPAKKSRKEKVN